MEMLSKLCAADSAMLLATPYRVVDVNDPANYEAASAWWNEMTSAGGEGMVVKPLDFISKGRRGTTQPAIKCRGPDKLLPVDLDRLRSRGVGAKRSLASRELASVSRPLSVLSDMNPLGAVMNASSECWRWKASLSIRGFGGTELGCGGRVAVP